MNDILAEVEEFMERYQDGDMIDHREWAAVVESLVAEVERQRKAVDYYVDALYAEAGY